FFGELTMNFNNLKTLGWNEFFERHFQPYAANGYAPGRVASDYKHSYCVYTESGKVLGETSGRLRHEALDRGDLPVVGDWVVMRPCSEGGKVTIHAVLARTSKFMRKMAGFRTEQQIVASNIDTVFLVTSLNQDFNLRRVERYLIVAWESGARPVIVLSKSDLCEEIEERKREIKQVAGDAPIHAVSVVTQEGLDELERYLERGQTVALLGSSGVGKSTLINHWLGREYLRVRETREHDGRGMHTTTHRELIVLPQGGLVLDTPGMRELQLWDGEAGLHIAFADIETRASHCYFSDCRHQDEPRCAIREALAEGEIDTARYQSYEKLQKELKHLALKQDVRSAIAEKKRWKRLSRAASQRAQMKRR
ncbi:MAG TPA: ribosome small subunit-dependent GTPase A, partial [Pyrinomonadaceae bacterium]|nr:ribosome small subunit-dependent GTPase A [Pyrinomonadaceae bacterium]